MKLPEAKHYDLEAALRKIEDTAAALLNIPPTYVGPLGTKVPDIAWYVFAAIKKTRSLSHAFCLLIREKNSLAATALIRLQLDTALRISGLSLVDDLENAGAKLMNDESFRKLKSRDGKWLTDAILHENLDKHYPGLSYAYKATSSYVHLSASHIKPGLVERPGSSKLFFHMNATDDAKPYESFVDVIDWFDQATELTAIMIEDFMRFRYVRQYGEPQRNTAPTTSNA
ncbi:MAG: hypothetical protein RLW68_05280 [Devosia marina]|uniref:hypothetical protein n=1 Tax=Devosia marina TaxID=2683198 RepID=UPI0032EF70E4